MSDYIKRIQTDDGDKQIDFLSLANLPGSSQQQISVLAKNNIAAGNLVYIVSQLSSDSTITYEAYSAIDDCELESYDVGIALEQLALNGVGSAKIIANLAPLGHKIIQNINYHNNSDTAHSDTLERKHHSCQCTLYASGWSDKKQAVTVDGVTDSNTIIVCPDVASRDLYSETGIYCSAQQQLDESVGTLTFECEEVPTEDLTANVVILGG